MALRSPLTPLTARLGAVVRTWRGQRLLRRGDARGAIRAFEGALRARPKRYAALVRLVVAHLCAREVVEARRYLLRAREADPVRYDREAAGYVARAGFDLEAIYRPVPRTRAEEPVVRAAVAQPSAVRAESLPFGDCRDLDEYARFQAMPPISRAEVEGTDWDRVVADLLDE